MVATMTTIRKLYLVCMHSIPSHHHLYLHSNKIIIHSKLKIFFLFFIKQIMLNAFSKNKCIFTKHNAKSNTESAKMATLYTMIIADAIFFFFSISNQQCQFTTTNFMYHKAIIWLQIILLEQFFLLGPYSTQ